MNGIFEPLKQFYDLSRSFWVMRRKSGDFEHWVTTGTFCYFIAIKYNRTYYFLAIFFPISDKLWADVRLRLNALFNTKAAGRKLKKVYLTRPPLELNYRNVKIRNIKHFPWITFCAIWTMRTIAFIPWMFLKALRKARFFSS